MIKPLSTSRLRISRSLVIGLGLLIGGFSVQVFADDTIFSDKGLLDRWQVTGFGTIGWAQTDKYSSHTFRRNVYQDGAALRDDPYKMDSRLGLQMSGRLSQHWDVVAQFVTKHRYRDDFTDHFEQAFVRYTASDNWQVALGRQASDLFFLSDHRNVGYSYNWIRPPTEFYGYLPTDYFDGAKVSYQWGDFDNAWSLSLAAGNTEDLFQSYAILGDQNELDPTQESGPGQFEARSYNMELAWRGMEWALRLNFADVDLKTQPQQAQARQDVIDLLSPIYPDTEKLMFALTDIEFKYIGIGASWERNGWKLQSELAYIDTDNPVNAGERGYIHLARKIGDWTPYLTYGYSNDDTDFDFRRVDDLDLPPIPGLETLLRNVEDGFDTALRANRHNHSSVGIGVRWDFAPQKALKLQCDRFDLQSNSANIHGSAESFRSQGQTRSWCAASLDWVF